MARVSYQIFVGVPSKQIPDHSARFRQRQDLRYAYHAGQEYFGFMLREVVVENLNLMAFARDIYAWAALFKDLFGQEPMIYLFKTVSEHSMVEYPLADLQAASGLTEIPRGVIFEQQASVMSYGEEV